MDNVLVGMWCLKESSTHSFEAGEVGQILGQVNGNHFLVQLYLDGEGEFSDEANPTKEQLVSPYLEVDIINLEDLKKWLIYPTFEKLAEKWLSNCKECRYPMMFPSSFSRNAKGKPLCGLCKEKEDGVQQPVFSGELPVWAK